MSQGRVLVVDDEPDYRSLMRAHLERRGYEVGDAANGKEALEVLSRDGAFHVLVADLMMPEMDGLELLRRAKEHDPDLEVVVISGVGTLESAISSMRMGGAYDYLPKPLDSITDLSLAVARAAEHRRMRVERRQLQEQVAAERERLRTVIENTNDALLSSEDGETIAVANPAALELLQAASLEGEAATEALPATLAALLANWLEFQPGQAALAEVVWPANRMHLVSLTPVDQSAEQRGWVMILREVSRIRQLQRKKMQLLAQAADGLQAPLAEAIQSLLELNELPEEADERFTGSVQRGMQNLGAIRSWTEEVLALVTFEAGQEAAQDPLPLSQLVGEFESASNDEVFEGKQLQLEVEISEAVKVKVEPKPARRLLQHLVRQAAWRSKVNSQIKVILEEDDRQTWLKVRDEADKLMEADDPTLFDQFMATQGEELEGIALSLAMIKTTVDVLGGQLWMWSDDDGGNTFAVALPHRAGDQTE
jgi:CheY-like chemotaxis protein